MGMVEKKENKRHTHPCCLLHANCKWEMVMAEIYSPCGLSIRRDRDSYDQNPIVVGCHQAVVVALKMRQEHLLTLHA